jgi:hypothetical protein
LAFFIGRFLLALFGPQQLQADIRSAELLCIVLFSQINWQWPAAQRLPTIDDMAE